jgi:uncharacterized protein YdcH (DUF465 family)
MRKAVVFGFGSVEQLVRAHRAMDERVKELGRHAYLTAAEQVEITELKKLKLATKDRMTAIGLSDCK